MISSLYDKFMDWSKGGSVYLMSDPHFEDNDCRLMNPNWISPEEHIEKINSVVRKSDTLICLGDVGNPEWFDKIKSRNIILIKGNHDRGNMVYAPYFNEIYEGALFIGEKILLSHEPINGLPFCLNIHGHCHNGDFYYQDDLGGEHMNVCSDVTNFEVLNLADVIKRGCLSKLKTIHRLTIDNQTMNSILRKEEANK